MESGDWVHEDQPRMQVLLCGATVKAPEGDGAGELSKRIQTYASTTDARVAAELEISETHIRQLDERSLS